ncbi:hypothetical protein WJX77_000588 [Trebouxia sp. C0004]
MHNGPARPYSQPIPEDVFGPSQDAAAASVADAGSSTSPKAVSVLYSRGDTVWYRQRDGTDVPAKVVAVDMAVYPPSYGVMIGDNIRETEASRLRIRGSVTPQQPLEKYQPSLPDKQTPELDRQGTSSGASFGDFTDAADTFALPHADHVSTIGSSQVQTSQQHVVAAADRSAPLSLSLFGEDSTTSFSEELPASLQVGPVWSPAWLTPPSPSASQHAQQPPLSHSSTVPYASSAGGLPPPHAQHVDEGQSEFGSFTGNASQPRAWRPSMPQVESAQDHLSEADMQAPSPLHAAITTNQTGLSNHHEEGFAGLGPALRPATAAARASLLQSMDRSLPISLGLFGEQSYEDPVLEPADQSIAHAQDATSHQEAAPSSAGHASWRADQVAFASPISASGLPETVLTDLEPSWQQVGAASAPGHTSSSWLPDQAAANVPEPSWQGAESNHPAATLVADQTIRSDLPDSMWHGADQQAFSSVSTLPDQDQHMFAAMWPQPGTDTSPLQPPSRQAVSGPISLELFGLEEREDEPLEIPIQTIDSASGAERQLEGLVTQSIHSFADPQQLSLSSQVALGPVSLQLVGGVEASDAPLELPIQAAITVVPTAETSCQDAGNERTGVSEVVRQASPGPVSLEIFGLEEKEDEPLELPLQAAITVLPTPDPVAQETASQAGFWAAQTLLMQACASELTRGHHIWSQVIDNDAAEDFLQDSNGAAYLQALRQVWVVALLLQASADMHGVTSHEASATQHAFLEASRQSMARVLGDDQADTEQSLSTLLTAQEVQQQVHGSAQQAAQWLGQSQLQHADSSLKPASMQHEGLCQLSLLPVEVMQMATVQLAPGRDCLAIMAALWTNRVGLPVPHVL